MQRGPDVNIANGAALSDPVDLRGKSLIGIIIPAAWTAANITIQAAPLDSMTKKNVHKSDGTEYTIVTGGQDRIILFNLNEVLAGLNYVIFRSGTSGAPVNQAAARVLIPLFG